MNPTNVEQLPGWGWDLLAEARVARLGFVDDAVHPRVLPVCFVVNAGSVWTAVDAKPKRDPGREPARVGFLRRNPRAALTVDRYDEDWSRLAWVQLLGDVQVLDVAEAPEALAALTEKYGQYRAQPPPGPLLRLEPRRALWWSAAAG